MILAVLVHAILSERKYVDQEISSDDKDPESCELGFAVFTDGDGTSTCVEAAQVADVAFPHEDECALMLQSRILTNDVVCPRG